MWEMSLFISLLLVVMDKPLIGVCIECAENIIRSWQILMKPTSVKEPKRRGVPGTNMEEVGAVSGVIEYRSSRPRGRQLTATLKESTREATMGATAGRSARYGFGSSRRPERS